MAPRKRTTANGDLPDNLYSNGGYYRYKHPQTGAFHGMGTSKSLAIEAAKKLNAMLAYKTDLVRKILGESSSTWAELVKRYKNERQASERKKDSTVREENYRLEHIAEGLGKIALESTTQRLLSDWLDNSFTRNPYTKHRGTLIKLMAFGIAKGMFPDGTTNLAAATLPEREGDKVRSILLLDHYNIIREAGEPWAQVGFDYGLVSLQRLSDNCMARYSDIHGDEIDVIQNKTERHGIRARLRITMGSDFADVIARSRKIQPVCPFIIHRAPQRIKAFKGQEHWAQVRGPILSRAFNAARDRTGLYKDYGHGEAPTYHEIRGLGAAEYLRQGFSKEYVNLLMGHTTMAMTNEYTDQHDNWTRCSADLKLR